MTWILYGLIAALLVGTLRQWREIRTTRQQREVLRSLLQEETVRTAQATHDLIAARGARDTCREARRREQQHTDRLMDILSGAVVLSATRAVSEDSLADARDPQHLIRVAIDDAVGELVESITTKGTVARIVDREFGIERYEWRVMLRDVLPEAFAAIQQQVHAEPHRQQRSLAERSLLEGITKT